MNRTVGIMRMHWKNRALWLGLPWMIAGITFFVNLVIGYFVGKEEPYYTGALCSIFIMVGVLGAINVAQTFPFAIGFSVRRKDYFFGTASFAVVISAVFAAVLVVLTLVEQGTNGWGERMHYFYLPWLSDGWAIARFWVFFVGLLHLFFIGFVYSSVHRRFGRVGVTLLSLAIFVAMSVAGFLLTYYDWWGQAFDFFKPLSAPGLFSWLAIPIPLYAALSYRLLRKSVS